MAGPESRRRAAWWFGHVLDWLYPSVCAVCDEVQRGGRALCGACDAELPRLVPPFCSRCGEHFEGSIDGEFTCPNCSNLKFSFEFARPAMMLDERTRTMIHRLKYGRGIHLAAELGRLAAEGLEDPRFQRALEEKWPLVPVPLHARRQAWRHFNQAEEIARAVGKISGLPVLRALRRVRMTEAQTHLTRAQRLKNLRGAFDVRGGGADWPRKEGAILVDDVFTTGSTVDACAKALRKAGFRSVLVLTVMRG
ncbi:ComF family protein [Luteolibacter sp. SL250]|uniref:ComF family protein n=1 Tax=Luteolibacter sp. SL250 TaxID=2995170 RepID=UPI00226FCC41|nr:ComF family protein [Luteolibacter sp. SL250]WAC19689.1 ComF family protein [Luteolibacter sp. SL250]